MNSLRILSTCISIDVHAVLVSKLIHESIDEHMESKVCIRWQKQDNSSPIPVLKQTFVMHFSNQLYFDFRKFLYGKP